MIKRKAKKMFSRCVNQKRRRTAIYQKRFCEPLFANYTLPKAYFDTDLKKLVDANNDRTKKDVKAL